MEYLIGVGLAGLVCGVAMLTGFDRGRVFYPARVTVIDILFTAIGNSTPALALESAIAGAFLALAVAENLWLIVAALAGHGAFDFLMTCWFRIPMSRCGGPGSCLSFDVLAGEFLAMLLMRRSGFASAA